MSITDAKLEQAQLLIDRIRHSYVHDMKFNRYNYGKLLSLSEKISYLYGQALAHAYLARHFQMSHQEDTYHFHLEKAESIAKNQNYFDILIHCYLTEGRGYLNVRNEIAALSIYLKGLSLAMETGDQQQSAVFYTHIGEVFRISGADEDAIFFYQKAVDELEDISGKESDFHKKNALLGLIHMFCSIGEKEKAILYYERAMEIPCEAENQSLLLLGSKIWILLIQGEKEVAMSKLEIMIEEIRQSKGESEPLKPVYLMLMGLLLLTEQKDHATWCMEQMDMLYKKAYPDMIIQMKVFHVRYAETFHLDEKKSYEDFYLTMLQNEADAKKATGESFKNLIDLYEVEKERERMVKEHSDLEKAVNTDELTGISNRRYLSKLITKAIQDKQLTALAYIMLDVDFFKEYNDYYGHSAGDWVLVQIAETITECLPKDAYTARYGGDEFACLLINKSDEEVVDFIKNFQKRIAKRAIAHARGGDSKVLTLSIGIYNETNLDNIEEHDLLQRADKALYQAKKQGRNGFAIYK